MSASLVGLGDVYKRQTMVPDPPSTDTSGTARSSSGKELWGLLAIRPRTVSYTHLTLPTICSV
eukprot:9930494-Alexandrium_andersonii.AAC.1